MRSLAGASILTVAATAVLVIGAIFWSVSESDRATKDRLEQTVAFALKQSVEQIPYDQESVAIWDDAVTNTRLTFDAAWVDINLGAWMYDYFHHDRVAVLDKDNLLLYAMADGKRIPTIDRQTGPAIALLARKLRNGIANGGLDAYAKGETRLPRAVDIGMVEQRPAIISLMPLVPHSDAVTQERGTETLIASVRFLDNSFLRTLERAHLLKGVRFWREGVVRSYEQTYPVRSDSGQLIGSIVWAPKLAGSDILAEILPALAAGLIFVALAVAALIRHLKRTYAELLTSEAQARHLASHDTLTGLANRGYFNTELTKALAVATPGDQQVALLFLDLDRFKQVNDTLGHAAGDALIREFASTLGAMLKPGDMLGRMGGDEFAIFMRNAASRFEVETLCRDIIATVSRPFEVVGGQASVGVSIGIAFAPGDATERSELARKADLSLYQSKRTGGQRFSFFAAELDAAVQRQRLLQTELRQALDEERDIDVAYQPIFAAGRLDIKGAEALARWNHPRLGAVSPLVFVALAEDCGLIDQLGDFVLRRACETVRTLEIETVAVNVSAQQLLKPDFARRVLEILSNARLLPSALHIELTERALMDPTGVASRALKTLRQAGVRVALDDFGSGQSSLGSVLKLEVDRIKIDKSVVRTLGETSASRAIVEAMVGMAHAVGVSVTAEGVETSEQLAVLTRIGADHMQGNLLSQPLQAQRLAEFIRSAKLSAAPHREVA